MSGWPKCSTREFLLALGEVLEEIDRLADRGISFPEMTRLCSEVWCAEADGQWDWRADHLKRTDVERKQPESGEARKAIRKLWLHGFEAAEIAKLTSVPIAKVDGYLEWARMEETSRLVISRHLDGLLVTKLADEFSMSRTRIEAILADAGYTPNIGREVKVGPGLRAMIHDCRADGMTSGQIAEKLNISIDRVKNILYPRKRA